MCLFIFSKYLELIDTVFLVLRKRKVRFLHWYHHFSVLLYCWHAYTWEMPTGLYFAAMNYTVHAVMYFYYFLSGVLTKPPDWALLVTVMQLLQMVGGRAIRPDAVSRSHLHICTYIYGTALGTPTPPPRGWSWFPAPPPVGVGGVVVDGWECWLMES